MNKYPRVLMIGSDTSVTGGMSRVIELYDEYKIFENDAIFLPSYKRGSVLFRIIYFIKFLFLYLYKLLTVKSIKIVHVHSSYKGSFFRKAIILQIAKLFGKKTIFHLHGSEFKAFYYSLPSIFKKLVQKILRDADTVIVLSEQWKNFVKDISKQDNIKVLYNPAVIKELKRVDSDKINVLFMGILCERKGVYDIIEAAKSLSNPDIVINLYGDGELDEFEKLINNNDLQDKIKIKGWISGNQKDEVFSNSDIYILPSYNEGLPMSILESMSAGLPVISTPVGGISEAVVDGVNGFLIPPGDSQALAEKIDLLANDKELRVKMGQAGYDLAKEKFDVRNIIRELEEIYDELLNSKIDSSKKIYLMLHDDWELKGNGLGSVQELQYKPAMFLMDLCEKLNIKMTFMIDVAQQLAFNRYQNHPEIKAQKELWDETVKLMKQRGFDIQLHIHPQWLNADYEKGLFYVNSNWNIGTYNELARRELLKESITYLKELISSIDADYQIHSFKPGAWSMQPSEGIVTDLSQAGIKLVIGIKKGLIVPSMKVDYTNLEEDTHPYYPDLKDITKVAEDKNNMIVLPLAYYCPSLISLSKLFCFSLRKKLSKIRPLSPAMIKIIIPEKIKRLKLISKRKINSLFRPYLTHLKIGNQPFDYLKESFDEVIKRVSKVEGSNIPVIIESHTKDFRGNYENIEKFLTYIVTEYKDQVEFITLSEFVKGIEENKFAVKHKD